MVAPLCSALVWPHLKSCLHPWGPQHSKEMGMLEQVQRRAMRVMEGLEYLSHGEGLKELELLLSMGKEGSGETSMQPSST